VIPACDGLEYPFGSLLAGAADLRSVAGWTENEDPDFDYGAIVLPPQQPYGDALGWFGFEPRDDATVASAILDLCGYPNDGGGPGMQQGTQWLTTGLAFESAARQLRYAIRADPGEDGAPVWMPNAAGGPCCVAIHTWSGINGSAGVRMNAEVFQRIAEWASEAP
jgi:glutamyl endopeptidase